MTTTERSELTPIGTICNYDGGVWAKKEGTVYYWGLETYDDFVWEEITQDFYDALIRFAFTPP